ncbi:MAG: endonuclease/exonuclease/phosphatase family protein [Candidatus Kapaibacterium sp.]
MKTLLIVITSFLLLTSCGSNNDITIGTFNIAWLGDGIDDKTPRTHEDIKNISQVISTLDADILALQEIENTKAIESIVDTVKYFIMTSTYPKEQKTALIINKKIEIVNTYQLDAISLGNEDLRPGLVAYCRYNGFDFFVGSFHFKSTSRYDDTPYKKSRSFDIRQEQSAILIKEIKKLVTIKNDKDVILLGDFNDNPSKKNSNIKALDNDEFDFLTSNMMSCKYSIWKSIDHIIVSQSMKSRAKNSTLTMIDINAMFPEEAAKKVSDHCPVIVKMNLDN